MAIPIAIPRLGWNMEEGTFGGWLKQDRDPVRAGEALFALESEKSTEEVECLDTGFLRIPATGPSAGDRLTVGTVIGYITASLDEELPVGSGTKPVRAAERTEPVDSRGPAIEERQNPEEPSSSPRARRAAKQLGIELTAIQGTGKNGRVRERDVRVASPLAASLLPITPIRRTIAARMLESQRTTAPVTLTTTANATNLVNLRDQFKAATDGGPVPSYTDFLVKLAAVALRQHPLLTGRWTDEGIRIPDAIHIGVAVDTDAGLLVPVVRDVPALGIRQLAAASRELIDWARAGRLTSADMQGGCFTVSNLGTFGIDAFTPIINHPECAVLGVGRIAKRPTVVADAVLPREQVTLSLTFDHRIVDGGPAAQFLQTLVQAVENPAPWVMTVV